LLRANAAEWLGVVGRRRSRRSFDGIPVEPWVLDRVQSLLDRWRPHADARVALIEEPNAQIFTGIVGSYGRVHDAPHVLAFVAETDADFADQHLGYAGEAVVLEATRLGLGTCWIGGFFNAKRASALVSLRPNERVLAVSPLGYATRRASLTERTMAGLAGAHRRKPVGELAPDASSARWPAWAVAAVETARLAPSAVNRQPWRFRFEDGGLVIAKDNFVETPKVTKRLDIGIAMLHAELAATVHGIEGIWTDLSGADVARFDPVVVRD
jgi:nitroreductase